MKKHYGTKIIMMVMCFTLIFSSLIVPVSHARDLNKAELEMLRLHIMQNYVDPVTREDLKGETAKEIFENLDSNSTYYNQEELDKFMEGIMGEFAGIGVYVKEVNGKILITEPIEGSPAHRAGILANDEIVKVEGETVSGLPLEEATAKIKGPVGTKVTLHIRRLGHSELIQFDIIREMIIINPISTEIIEDVGYIKITQFNEHTEENFIQALSRFYEQKIEKLIIDVRNNPGGSLDEVVNICRYLIPKGPIVHVEGRNFQVTHSSFLTQPMFKDLVILVNGGSASASEILAAAVQDSGAGTVIGTKTYGKGTVQRIYFLMNGEGFKLTEARYLSPNKRIIEGEGVIPDIEVVRYSEDLELEKMLPMNFQREYCFGEHHEVILAVQQRLKILQYTVEDEDGYFGEGTLSALQQFTADYQFPSSDKLTIELQEAVDEVFLQKIQSREYDMQFQYALEYLKNPKKKADFVSNNL